MPRVESTVEVDVPVDIAFALSQTYGPLRYRWDPFVRDSTCSTDTRHQHAGCARRRSRATA